MTRQPIRPRLRPNIARNRRGGGRRGGPIDLGELGTESVAVASASARRHHENRGRAGVSAASGTVRRRRGPIQPPRDAGTAGKSQHAEHEQTNQRCSSHGVSSRLDLVHRPIHGARITPDSAACKIPSAWRARSHPANSTVELDDPSRHDSFVQKKLSNCRIRHNVNNRNNQRGSLVLSSAPTTDRTTHEPRRERVAMDARSVGLFKRLADDRCRSDKTIYGGAVARGS